MIAEWGECQELQLAQRPVVLNIRWCSTALFLTLSPLFLTSQKARSLPQDIIQTSDLQRHFKLSNTYTPVLVAISYNRLRSLISNYLFSTEKYERNNTVSVKQYCHTQKKVPGYQKIICIWWTQKHHSTRKPQRRKRCLKKCFLWQINYYDDFFNRLCDFSSVLKNIPYTAKQGTNKEPRYKEDNIVFVDCYTGLLITRCYSVITYLHVNMDT